MPLSVINGLRDECPPQAEARRGHKYIFYVYLWPR